MRPVWEIRALRMNSVLPGPLFTPLFYGRGMSDEARETRRKSSLLQIEGTGWDVGNAVSYLVSNMARCVTGHSLIVVLLPPAHRVLQTKKPQNL
ncbi:MAG: hypothetical protein CMQ21_09700 [Gammaproteobacteria bacterium]|nr:hypothetical protein [Gammaproteobacteria bacterium]